MSKKALLRLLFPTLLLGAAVIIWLIWPRNAGNAGPEELPEGVAVALFALAAISALRSFFEDALGLPLSVWAPLAVAIVIAVLFLYSSVAGVIGALALVVLVGAFYLS